MRDYWELFATFSKLGLFTFGGGYAMLPLLESPITTPSANVHPASLR